MSDEIAQRAFQTALAMDHERTLSAIQGRVRAFAAPFGFDRFVLLFRFRHGGGGDRAYLLGRGRLVRRRRGRRCPDLRAALPGDPAHAAGQRAVFLTKTRVQQGERYRIVRTPRGAASHGVQIPVFGLAGLEGAVSLGRAYRRFTAGAAGAVAGGLGGLSGGAAAVRTGGRRGEGRLSAREREVLSWTAIGRRQADIAAMLGLSERTVENHLRRIRQRLGAATTAQAIGVAIRLGRSPPSAVSPPSFAAATTRAAR